ncbi:MAG: hypothetical protein R3B13_06390 [Polyangiaceae bacterium]
MAPCTLIPAPRVSAVACLLCVACGASPPRRSDPQRVRAPTLAPTRSAASTKDVAATPKVELHPVAEMPLGGSLFQLDGRLLLQSANFIAELHDDGLRVRDDLSRALELERPSTMGVVALTGDLAVVDRLQGGWVVGDLYLRRDGGFHPANQGARLPLLGASLWRDGKVLGLSRKPPARFVTYPSSRGHLPMLAPATGPGKLQACQLAKTALFPGAMLAFPSGDAFVAGSLCADNTPAVLHFAPNATTGELTTFEGGEDPGPTVTLVGIRPDDVWVSISKSLAHFDGKAWTQLTVPSAPPIHSLALTPTRTLILGTREAVRLRSIDGTWSERAFERTPGRRFEDAPTLSVAALADDDVWAVRGGVLYHSRASAHELERLEPEVHYRPPHDRFLPREVATPACKSVFVLVYSTAHFTPFEYDFPVLRRALGKLERHAQLKIARRATTQNERWFIGVDVPDLATATQVADAVKQVLPATEPRAYCYRSPAASHIDIESGHVESVDED